MSKKSRRKAEARKTKEEKLEVRKPARQKIKKKVFMLRLYERMFPGDYTPKQDRKHLLAMGMICLAIAVIIGACWWHALKQEEYYTSSQLVIPASSFVSGQENAVYEMLDGYGFKYAHEDDDGNIVSYGSPEMTQAYKDSFRNRSLKLARQKIDDGAFSGGVALIEVSDDAREMTLTTYWNVSENSTLLKTAVGDNDVSNIIDTYSIWCQMLNDGEKMTISFADIETGDIYYSTNQVNSNAIVAEKEAAERAAAKENKQEESPDDDKGNQEEGAETTDDDA